MENRDNGLIREFQGIYRWLSNFQPAVVTYDGVQYPSVEHAYQASKTWPEHRKQFEFGSPVDAKRLGKIVPMRPEFMNERLAIMRELCRQKFAIPWLRNKLLQTEDWLLVEGNAWNDTFWGQCRGVGENNLGRILMAIRHEIRNQ